MQGVKSPVHWEDITGTTSMKLVNDCVTFTTSLSARFWLVDCQNAGDAVKLAPDLYSELVAVPFMSQFVVFARRDDVTSGKLRLFCLTDDRIEKTLEGQERFVEVARSRDIEVLEGRPQYVEMTGNLAAFSKSGEQPFVVFNSFYESRLALSVRVRDPHQDPAGRVAFFRDPRTARSDLPQPPTCSLTACLPSVDDSSVAAGSDAGKFPEVDDTEIDHKTLKLNEMNSAEMDTNKRNSYVDASYDPLTHEMGSWRELGSSRESSMQRDASLDVSYDERDISRGSETTSEADSVIEREHERAPDSLPDIEPAVEEQLSLSLRDEQKTPVMELLQRMSDADTPQSEKPPSLQFHELESSEIQRQQHHQNVEMAYQSPDELSPVVADLARSDPVVELAAGHEDVDVEGREKGDDTGEDLTDKSDTEEWEVVEPVHEEEFVKTERQIISNDDVVIPQNLPDPELRRDSAAPITAVETEPPEEEMIQRVAVQEEEELREDGSTVVRRLTTMYHVRTEYTAPRFRGDEPSKVERLLGTEVEERITELAPGICIPYDDDAEVETMWDETEECLADGTWIKKKTTRITVQPPPFSIHQTVSPEPIVSRMQDSECAAGDQSGLSDSGYRDDTPQELAEYEVVVCGLPELQESRDSDAMDADSPTAELTPEVVAGDLVDLIGSDEVEQHGVSEDLPTSLMTLSAPGISVHAASPLPPTPPSDDEPEAVCIAANQETSPRGLADKTPAELPAEEEYLELMRKEDALEHFGVELSKFSQELAMGEEEGIGRADRDDSWMSDPVEDPQSLVPDDGEPIEGRLSTDTSEQIFISQQIEAEAMSSRQGPTELVEGQKVGLVESEEEVRTDPVTDEGREPRDIVQRMSPGKTSLVDEWKPEVDLKDPYWSPTSPTTDDNLITSMESESIRYELTEARGDQGSLPGAGLDRMSPVNMPSVFRDDLSPVTDLPPPPGPSKRKIAINIGASPSGFILEEDEEQEEETDAELEMVEARLFRPIVETQSSGEQPVDQDDRQEQGRDLEELQGHHPVNGTSLCDGPGEVTDDDAGMPSTEDFDKVDTGEVQVETAELWSQDTTGELESCDQVVSADTGQLIDLGEDQGLVDSDQETKENGEDSEPSTFHVVTTADLIGLDQVEAAATHGDTSDNHVDNADDFSREFSGETEAHLDGGEMHTEEEEIESFESLPVPADLHDGAFLQEAQDDDDAGSPPPPPPPEQNGIDQ